MADSPSLSGTPVLVTGATGFIGSRLAEHLATREGAVVTGPGGPEWNSVRDASEGPWPPGAEFELTPIETGVLGPEWAYDFGVTTVTYTPDGSSESRTLRHTGLVLFRKTEDGWKMYREVASPTLPPDSLMEQ